MSEPAKNIEQAILNVMAKLPAVAKDKTNKEQGYSYTSEEAVLTALRPLLIEQGIVIHLAEVEEHREEVITSKGYKLTRTWGKFSYEFRHVHSGTSKVVIALGEGMDSGDKSVYKAQTGSRKNAMFDAFQIPRKDDPENDGGEYQHQQAAETFKVPAKTIPAKPSAAPAQPTLELTPERPTWGKKGCISQKQAKRLYAIAKENGVSDEDLKFIVKSVAGVDHSSDILWKDKYDSVCKAVEGFHNRNKQAGSEVPEPAMSEDDIPF